ncbi:hypothetical protein LAG90_15085 [Marinilongibacter aquaticus]|uniref:hypothetical protein n=1 Tax=Marinilongibacter aquaticus TaxID=2975157 RepID=UPI0021BD9A80|nr:hypothetical protein [Marinilongibacter aquaticus]UBM58129.1 hypothetical protein LAG90_15085 [Marinilongibacter aquaticus]
MRLSIHAMRLFTLAYIAFPLFPFYFGWVKPIFGVPLAVLLVLGVGRIYRDAETVTEHVSKRNLLIGLAIVGGWLLFSGAGGFGFQFYDHVKNNTLTAELSEQAWPLTYTVEGKTMFLSHYLSYYIMGPFMLGGLGYKFAQLGVFLWASLGVVLGMFWLGRAAAKLNWPFNAFYVFFGGIVCFSFLFKFKADFISEIVSRIQNHGYVFWMNSWDVIPLNYQNITDMLYWTPQHFIPAILGIGLILNEGLIEKNIKYLPFALSLLAMWSPLVLLGLFPFFVYVLLYNQFKGIFNPVNLIIAPILFFVNTSFLLAIESGELVKHFIFTDLSAGGITLWEQILVYFYFLLFEVAVWVVPIAVIMRRKWGVGERPLFLLTVFVLCTIPLYRFGLWNDWCNRVSMPAIVLLGLFAYRAWETARGKQKLLLSVLLLLSGLGAFIDISGSLIYSGFRPKFAPPERAQVGTLPEITGVSYPIDQFVADEDAFFFKYLSQKPQAPTDRNKGNDGENGSSAE